MPIARRGPCSVWIRSTACWRSTWPSVRPEPPTRSTDGLVAARVAGVPDPQPSVLANIAQRLIQLHMCVVYLFAGAGKLLGETWWDGTALWGAFGNFEYQTLDMTWLAAYPLLVNLLTQTILVWEITYCVLVWPRLLRPLVLAMAVPLHLGIGLSMGMMTFGLAMLVGNVAFVPARVVRSPDRESVGDAGGAGQGRRRQRLTCPGASSTSARRTDRLY